MEPEFDEDSCSDLSSSSSSCSSSEEESVGEEEDEDSEEDAPSSGPKGAERGDKERRKRRRAVAGRRRQLRSKYESVEDFNPEARSAQTEEIERIRRLELQRSLQAAASSTVARPTSAVDRDGEPAALGRGPVFLNLAEEEKRERVEAIVISSDSEEEGEAARGAGREEVGPGAGKRVKLADGSAVKTEAEEEGGREQEGGGRYDEVGEGGGEKVVVNLGHGEDEEDVVLPPQIARIIKPHQVGGVRFLYDNLIESLPRFHTSTGFGCILAHSMGLGKTLQIISFIDIFFRYTPSQHVLCVVPVNTLQNWVVEFDKWLPDKEKEERKKSALAEKPSRGRNRRQNGRVLHAAKSSEPLRSASHSPLNETGGGSNSGLLSGATGHSVAKDPVSTTTFRSVAMEMGGSRLLPGSSSVQLSEADQQLLLRITSSNYTSKSPLFSEAKTPPTNPQGGSAQSHVTAAAAAPPGSHSHSPSPGAGIPGSHSNTASPNTPEIQYRSFKLIVLSETVRSMEARLRNIQQWRAEGGVLLIGYEMYRMLSLSVPSLGGNKMAVKKRKTKNSQANNQSSSSFVDLEENEKEMEKLMEIQRALCVPGPDLVVCDEGHRIKNDLTNISQALKKIQTRRRVVLTGYPLQNNLLEYWCMVDFVRPKYLGTKQEFCDLFERPISNGQCMDSTPKDVRTMRYRSHVLHTLLKGFVLRRGHKILKASLPPKFEHVLLVRPSPVQASLYDYNMSLLQQGGTSTTAGPLKAFAVCTKIWNHPDIYYNEARAQESKKGSPSSWLDEAGLTKNLLPKSESSSTAKIEWPTESLAALPPYETGRLDNSPKMVVAMEILDRSVQGGDKLLIFSQSLSTLSYIESLLVRRPIPIPHSAGPAGEVQYSGTVWTKNVNYCRLDGSTGSADRDRLITAFNSPTNKEMWVFLLSTRAGCLGINLIGANRVIVLDVSWNPCYDAQAVCRIYRYGQTKPCHIYRLVCDGMMERKIYDRQISKQGMADRVVDELQPERHFTTDEIITLMRPLAPLPAPQDFSYSASNFLYDQILMILCKHFGPLLTKLPFRHESLLLDSANEKMTDVEKYFAMCGFQQDWNALKRNTSLTAQRNSPVSPQPRQPGIPSPVPTPSATPASSSLCLSTYSNTRVGLPSSVLSPRPLQSHSNTTTNSQQYSHDFVPSSGSVGMGYGNVTVPTPVGSDIINLDSDSEVEWNQAIAHSSGFSHGLVNSQQMTSSQTTLLPGPKVLTVPIAPSLSHAHSSAGSTHFPAGQASSAHSSSSPVNPGYAQLLSFMKQGGKRGEGVPSNSSNLSSFPQNQPSFSVSNALPTSHPGILSQPLASVMPNMGQHTSNSGQQFSNAGEQPSYSGQQQPVPLQQMSVAGQNHFSASQQSSLAAPISRYDTTVMGHQVSGHPPLNSGQPMPIMGRATISGHPESTLPTILSLNTQQNVDFSVAPANLASTLTSGSHQAMPSYPSSLTSLLQPTQNTVPSLQAHKQVLESNTNTPVLPHPVSSVPGSNASSLLPLSLSTAPHQLSTGYPNGAGHHAISQQALSANPLPVVPPGPVTLPETAGGLQDSVLQSHAPHNAQLPSSPLPLRPLFSPPRKPLSREATLVTSSPVPPSHLPSSPYSPSHSAVSSLKAQYLPVSSPLSATTASQNHPSHVPTPSPAAPLFSPHPPPSSLPCSPSTALTPSPPSQPPTPSTSIPLLSPVAAHFFQISMSKSPKPSPSPSHSPSPHPPPLSSPPLLSPPSVATAMSPAAQNFSNNMSSSNHSVFHNNSTAHNHDDPSSSHGNLPGSYGNSYVMLQ